MGALSSTEQKLVERAAAEPMLAQVEAWAAINSGSRNLDGLTAMAGTLADAFAALPGSLVLEDAATVQSIDNLGRPLAIEHGRNLHLKVRPEAPVQLLLTGHMDTVFGLDHPFQTLTWLEDGVLGVSSAPLRWDGDPMPQVSFPPKASNTQQPWPPDQR